MYYESKRGHLGIPVIGKYWVSTIGV